MNKPTALDCAETIRRLNDYLDRNDSYVFFTRIDHDPHGASTP